VREAAPHALGVAISPIAIAAVLVLPPSRADSARRTRGRLGRHASSVVGVLLGALFVREWLAGL
jgi:hypothetical protein